FARRVAARLQCDPGGIACDAWSNFVLKRTKFIGGRIIVMGFLAGEAFRPLQSVCSLLSPCFRPADLAPNAVQEVFRLLLGCVKLLDQLALLDKAEFQLRERTKFLEALLTQPCRFLRSRPQSRVKSHFVGSDLDRCFFNRVESLPSGDHSRLTI